MSASKRGRAGFLIGVALLSGCATNSITGRDQIIALPAVQAAHADLSFAVSTGVQGLAALPACLQDCGKADELAAYARKVAEISARLEVAARDIDPELFARIGKFQVETSHALGTGTGSSAGGRIVIGNGIIALEPTDAVIGFLLAREMAHVIARHAEENSGAAILFSALGMLFPGFHIVARLAATRIGADALASSWAAQQQREADEIAVALLEFTGLTARAIALELEIGIRGERLPDGEWGRRYLESARHIEAIAASPPRYAVISR